MLHMLKWRQSASWAAWGRCQWAWDQDGEGLKSYDLVLEDRWYPHSSAWIYTCVCQCTRGKVRRYKWAINPHTKRERGDIYWMRHYTCIGSMRSHGNFVVYLFMFMYLQMSLALSFIAIAFLLWWRDKLIWLSRKLEVACNGGNTWA